MESESSEIVNECIRSVVPFGKVSPVSQAKYSQRFAGTVGITGIYTGLANQFAIGEVRLSSSLYSSER